MFGFFKPISTGNFESFSASRHFPRQRISNHDGPMSYRVIEGGPGHGGRLTEGTPCARIKDAGFVRDAITPQTQFSLCFLVDHVFRREAPCGCPHGGLTCP